MTDLWHRVGLVTDIPRRGARCVDSPFGRIAVFRTAEDRIFALADQCPHKGGPLSQGIVHDTSVTCPLHNAVISLQSGEMAGPDEGRVRRFAVRVDPLTEVIELSLADNAERLHAAE
ncbi:nitrite reductase small subunit NirD [Jiella sp. MQZ9-1]|uniref:Nitrite reductase small subunit NirD n=1 Tax=Jiella flava TaxID=2816857 RepID=A0A939G137_9HYPH|nr:nitrite reductase small subunit NirD [Jiella flava]MBO0664426.1 nitrite reductase small subunit NirD [Jiella flava]MCD2473062.1 nitrite reductase small subunit NirD [Jiella flava]